MGWMMILTRRKRRYIAIQTSNYKFMNEVGIIFFSCCKREKYISCIVNKAIGTWMKSEQSYLYYHF
jgi:hypothetical protein